MRTVLALLLLVLAGSSARASDYSVEKLDEAPPADVLAAEIVESLQATGVRVVSGSRTICDIWLAKSWPVASLESPPDVIYPFQTGQLIGAIRLPRRTDDFRAQQISRGTYPLRFALQPVDGAHVGTSPTRDFLLMLPADQDRSAEPMDEFEVSDLSMEVAGTAHPALWALKPATDGERPSMYHHAPDDWWLVRLEGTVEVGGQTQPLKLDLVVVGVADY